MLYVIFGFFGASIGAALGFVIGLLWPQWFFGLANPPTLEDGQWGDIIVGCYLNGFLIGALFGGVLGLFTAYKINQRK